MPSNYKVSTELGELYYDLRQRKDVDADPLDWLGKMYALASLISKTRLTK